MNDTVFDKLVELSKFDFPDETRREFAQDLNNIIEFVGKVKEFDGKYDDTLEHKVSYSDLRDDVESRTASSEQLLSNTESDKNCYIIPRVID